MICVCVYTYRQHFHSLGRHLRFLVASSLHGESGLMGFPGLFLRMGPFVFHFFYQLSTLRNFQGRLRERHFLHLLNAAIDSS